MKVFYNGTIYTMEGIKDVYEAMTVQCGKVIACGTSKELLRLNPDEAIDLEGRTVLPGFIDSHQHILSHTNGLQSVNLRGAKSWEEVKARLAERAAGTPAGQWVKGSSFNHEDWVDSTLPTRKELDEISPDHPILISRYCMHIHIANSRALASAGIDRNFTPTAENSVALDEKGDPTGVLVENAVTPILDIIPDPLGSNAAKKEAIAGVLMDMSRYGITGAHPIQGKFCDAEEFLWIYQDLENEGRLPVRLYVSFDEYPSFGMRTGFGNEKIRYGFFKIYSDGSLGSRSAKLYEPYSDMPGQRGVQNFTQEEINAMCQKAYDMNLQIGIHAIGDMGLEIALNAIEKVYHSNPKPNQRFRLIHVICLNEDLIARMKKLPVVLDVQPKFVSSDLKWAEDRLGPERVKYAYIWRRLLDEGFTITGGSDSPVEPYNPFLGIHSIVTRKDLEGYPEGGWYPDQRVTVYEAIEMYTKNSAYASFEEEIKGTLKPGKLADFIVIDRNPFTIDPDTLKDVKVLKTYLGGEEVYAD